MHRRSKVAKHSLHGLVKISGCAGILQVYAIDLLGFGRSDKPLLSYSTELWQDQVLDFLTEFVDGPAILVGNSIGSLISLMVGPPSGAARSDLINLGMTNTRHSWRPMNMWVNRSGALVRWRRCALSMARHLVQVSAEGGQGRVKGSVLLNCAGGMNTKVSRLCGQQLPNQGSTAPIGPSTLLSQDAQAGELHGHPRL